MKTVTHVLKSKEYGDHSYTLELYESVKEAVSKIGEEKVLALINQAHKANANAAEWGRLRGTTTELVELPSGKTARISKEIAAMLAGKVKLVKK